MQPNENPSVGCNDGSEMWHDYVLKYGFDEALIICRNYLNLNLKREHSDDEYQFTRELFFTMFQATSNRTDPDKLVYAHDCKTAYDFTEPTYYHKSRDLNTACAKGIDRLISDSYYKENYYNLKMAAICAIHDYGFQRVCLVLGFNFQFKGNDARFSTANRQWANTFIVQEEAFNDTWLQSHATLVNSFCDYIRELYNELDAERFMLPGSEEHGEFVSGREIKRAITTSDDGNGFSTGYAIGYNPDAVEPWVCWQFAVRDGERHYNWGVYSSNEQAAIDSYNSRVFVALN